MNELTGKEWIYFLNSVWITAYPPTAGKDTAFDLRKIHPSPKPPELMRDIISFFTKSGQRVLDPFAGVGGTLLGASLCDRPRRGVGIELNPAYTKAFDDVAEALDVKDQRMILGDCRDEMEALQEDGEQFDLVLTDPPYGDMMHKKKNGQKSKLYGKADPTPFTNDERDVGNLDYANFLPELRRILEQSISMLKDKGYLVVFCKDMQPDEKNANLVHADVVSALNDIPGIRYRGMRIWHDQATDLYPFGYPFAFVMNQMHQYILIFRKE